MGFRRWPRHQDSRVEAKTCRIWPRSIESWGCYFKFRMPVPTLRAESLLLYEMSAVPRHDQNEKQCRLQKAVNAFPEWPLVEIIEVIHSVFGLECRNVRRCRFCKLEVCETPSVGTIRPFAWLRNMMSVPLFARAATNLPSARYHIVA